MPRTDLRTASAGLRAWRWAYDSDLMPPGYPLWRYTIVRSALFEVMTTLSALTMITWSPVSMWGANVGLCLPRRMRATSVHRRPSTMPSASTTCHSRWISLAFGVYVAMPQSASIRWGRSVKFVRRPVGPPAPGNRAMIRAENGAANARVQEYGDLPRTCVGRAWKWVTDYA